PLARLWVQFWRRDQIKDRPGFELLPAFSTDIHPSAVQADPQRPVVVTPCWWQDHPFHPHGRLVLLDVGLQPFAVPLGFIPNARGRYRPVRNARKDFRRLPKRWAAGRQPDHLLGPRGAIDAFGQFPALIQGGKTPGGRWHSSSTFAR